MEKKKQREEDLIWGDTQFTVCSQTNSRATWGVGGPPLTPRKTAPPSALAAACKPRLAGRGAT